MTVLNKTNFIRANGDGAVVAFEFSFPVKQDSDIVVKKILNATGVATTQTINSDYTVVLNTTTEGGTVTYTVAPLGTEDSFLKRAVDRDQQTALPVLGTFKEVAIENELDRSRLIDIEQQEQLGRCIIITETASLSDIQAPSGSSASDRALGIWGWDSAGTGLTLYSATIIDAVSVIASKGDIVRGSDAGAAEQLTVGADGTFLAVWDADGKPNYHQLGKKGADVASATALPLLNDGIFNYVTGTTTITSMDSVGVGAIKVLHFDGILTLTHHATDLILPSGANITTKAGDIGVFHEYATGDWRLVSWSGVAVGSQVQQVNVVDGEVATGTTVMVDDDTIPQITEGDEYMTLAITPRKSTNLLKIDVTLQFTSTVCTTDANITALFQDTTADALAVGWAFPASNNKNMLSGFTFFMTAGTTSATTFRVRAGATAAGTTTINGFTGSRFYGGALASSIVITEIEV